MRWKAPIITLFRHVIALLQYYIFIAHLIIICHVKVINFFDIALFYQSFIKERNMGQCGLFLFL